MFEEMNSICIRPTTSVYATYRRLSYKPWFALAEFVDNSTQSYYQHKEILHKHWREHGEPEQLKIEIDYDSSENVLSIIDNAFGMELDNFTRALVLDSPPSDRTGRSEYGMGLKTAACWFGVEWSVETSELGSTRCYFATINVEELAKSNIEDIEYSVSKAKEDSHFTRITIKGLNQPIRGRTINRVLDQLKSIYRDDLRSGSISILWSGAPLLFEDPQFYNEEELNGEIKVWKKSVSFEVPREAKCTNLSVKGWIGLRDKGKQRDAGLVLLRRGRVIIGGPEQGYKPVDVFGQANSFRSQRLIGELHMDDWPVTQAKDGFDWSDGLEDSFIEELIKVCKEYGDKAESIRVLVSTTKKPTFEEIAEPIKQMISSQEFSEWVNSELQNTNKSRTTNREPEINKEELPLENIEETSRQTKVQIDDEVNNLSKSEISTIADRVVVEQNVNIDFDSNHIEVQQNVDIDVGVNEVEELKKISGGPIIYTLKLEQSSWVFKLYWQNQLSTATWMGVRYPGEDEIDIYLNMAHPFFEPYLQNEGVLQIIHKFVIALALAEKMARKVSTLPNSFVDPSDFRTYMNKVLRRTSELEVKAT